MPKRIPSYRPHKPSGQAVVTLNGKDFYLGPWQSQVSRQEYDRLIGEWLANGRRLPQGGATSDLSMSELLAAYLEFAKSYYVKHGKPTGQQGLIKLTARLVRQTYGHARAIDLGPLALKALQEGMIRDGLSRRYINDHCERIKRMFKWAVSEELLPVDAYRALTTVPGLKKGRTAARETDPVLPVSDADFEATLPELSAVVRAMVQFQRLTGCRPGEVRIIRPCDVDRAGEVWRYAPGSHETEHQDRQRLIFIGPRAQDELRPWLLRPARSYCFSPKESASAEIAAQGPARSQRQKAQRPRPGRRGAMYTKDSYHRAITRACARAGVTPWSPNQLRHSRATDIRKLFGLEASQVVLGHSRADVTQVYAERDFALAQRIMREIGYTVEREHPNTLPIS